MYQTEKRPKGDEVPRLLGDGDNKLAARLKSGVVVIRILTEQAESYDDSRHSRRSTVFGRAALRQSQALSNRSCLCRILILLSSSNAAIGRPARSFSYVVRIESRLY